MSIALAEKAESSLIDKTPDEENIPSVDAKQMYIVSSQRVQDELLLLFLEKETGARCLHVDSLKELYDKVNEEGDRPMLTLVDCFSKSRDEILSDLESDYKKVLSEHQHPVCLFNVPPGIGIEIKAIEQGVHGFFYNGNVADQQWTANRS